MKVRREYLEMEKKLCKMGMRGTGALFHCTPREIGNEVRAFLRGKEEGEERDAFLAWAAGRYFAIGMHAPGRYPPPPRKREEAREMNDDEMKRVMLALAGRKR